VVQSIHDLREELDMAGFAVAVVASPTYTGDDWKTQIITSGQANVYGDPVTLDSLFTVASNSKFFTALSVGMLIRDGVTLPNGTPLGWNSKMKDILPGWSVQDKYAQDHLELADLLCEQPRWLN